MFFGILVLSLQAPLVSPKESGPYYEHLQEMRGQLKKAGVLPASGTAAPKPLFLPVPLVPLKDSGQYYEHLQEMQEQLKKGDMICFYTLAQEFIDKVKGNRTIRRIEKRPENNREDAVAWMWWNYYLASAPLISFDQLEKGRIPNHDRYELDIDRKCDALSGFIGSEIEKKA